jgi:hypothetical protein
MIISYCTGINILGVRFTSSIAQSVKTSWTRVNGQIRSLVRDVYGRDLCLTQRIQYVHIYLLAKIWHIAQLFPVPKEHMRRLTTAISWYIRKGAILRVPLSTLQSQTERGGLGLIDIVAKCRTIFLTRLRDQEEGDQHAPKDNPPNIQAIPRTLEFIRIYVFEWAYITRRRQDESRRAFARRVYITLRKMYTAECTARELRVMQLQPRIYWATVWNNFYNTRTSEGARPAWYVVIHDILPTHTSLHIIRLGESEAWSLCGKQDTTLHRLMECGISQGICECTLSRLALIHRTDQKWIPTGWLLWPNFRQWPRRHQETLWILGNMVHYVVQNRRTMSLQDCIDFLHRTRWKTYQGNKRMELLGNYLEVL